MNTIADNIKSIQQQITEFAHNFEREANSIQLIAVSKTKPISAIEAAYAIGQRHFGENYLQEAVEKRQNLADLDIQWHFIGPLQSNKTKVAAENFDWVHTVDRLKIAQRLSSQRPADLSPLNVCLQVNISGEASKSGVALAELAELAQQVSELPQLALRGLMAIPAATQDPEEQRHAFRQLANAFKQLKTSLPELDTLSMGMSGDMEAAIAEGATFVRIGSAIFGERDTNKRQ